MIHRVSLSLESEPNGPRNCRLPVCTRWVNIEEDEAKREEEDRVEVRERERDRNDCRMFTWYLSCGNRMQRTERRIGSDAERENRR